MQPLPTDKAETVTDDQTNNQIDIVATIEKRAAEAGIGIKPACRRAGVPPSTFFRWKSGDLLIEKNANKILRAIDDLEAEKNDPA